MPSSSQPLLPDRPSAPTVRQAGSERAASQPGFTPPFTPYVDKPLARSPLHARATVMLLAATALWGLSFPLAKAVQAAQSETLVPGASTWFLAAVALVFRFGLAAAVLALGAARTLRTLSKGEVRQGIGLGIFGGGGMFLQMDGLSHTAASTSAFLTSCGCVIVPMIVAVERRRWPAGRVLFACGLVLAGTATLAGVNPGELFRLGRGEVETLASACFFAGQIWWVERPAFARNRTAHGTLVMFTVIALLGVVLLAVHSPGGAPAREFAAACASWPVAGFLLALTVFCTIITFSVMNHWQRHVEATEAGLIYCAEPVWTSLFALFLPAILGALAGIAYPNETLTFRLLLGGGLITLANAVIQLRPSSPPAAVRTPSAGR